MLLLIPRLETFRTERVMDPFLVKKPRRLRRYSDPVTELGIVFRLIRAKEVEIHSRHLFRRTGADERIVREFIAATVRVVGDCSHAWQT